MPAEQRIEVQSTVEVLAIKAGKVSWKPTEEGQHQGVIVPRREGESVLENFSILTRTASVKRRSRMRTKRFR